MIDNRRERRDSTALPGDCQRELADILSREELCLSRLLQSLEQERTALEKRQLGALEEAVKEKELALEEAAGLHRRRANLLEQYGFSNDESGVARCIEQCAPSLSRELRPLWRRLHHLIRTCHDQNLVNGQILELSRQSLRQTLEILTQGAREVELYTPQGVSTRQPGSTPLAKA